MNNRIDAIYARQSVDKKDSISIESQIEFCKYELKGGNCKEYTDKGYSGKNTDRPKFQELVRDIKRGLIAKVVVYKLDRTSPRQNAIPRQYAHLRNSVTAFPAKSLSKASWKIVDSSKPSIIFCGSRERKNETYFCDGTGTSIPSKRSAAAPATVRARSNPCYFT